MKFKRIVPLLLILTLLFLSACDKQAGTPPEEPSTPPPSVSVPPVTEPEPAPEPEPEPGPYDGPVNPLTGLPIDGQWANARPMAVMINNLKKALPQQGNGGADIIYEVVAEGGITRMLGVYQTVEGVGVIGSVRSSRPYYIELALGHDAIYIHAGGSTDAYTDMSSWKVDHMDGVNGHYSDTSAGLFWRDRDRVEGHHYSSEHSLITAGKNILAVLEKSGFRLEHEENYVYDMTFAEDGTPEGGETAVTVTVPFSSYKTGVFRYDEESASYLVEEYGEPYIDGNSGEQIAVTNVLVLQTSIRNSGDSYGHMIVNLTGGDGWFACGGKAVPITWEKGDRSHQISYYLTDGTPLTLGQGKSYVNIISTSKTVTFE